MQDTKRQAIIKAQGMADHEERVMLVLQQDGEWYIRPAAEFELAWALDLEQRVNVVAPTGTWSGYSATDILLASVAWPA